MAHPRCGEDHSFTLARRARVGDGGGRNQGRFCGGRECKIGSQRAICTEGFYRRADAEHTDLHLRTWM